MTERRGRGVRVGAGADVGPALGGCLAARGRAGVDSPVVATAAAGHGLAVARNAALERAGAADVLAYVDDDVARGRGLAARAAARRGRRRPRGVAAIGGPLARGRPRRPAARG